MRPLRQRLHDTIFQHDEPAERAFDVVVIVCILLSVLVVMLDSVESISAAFGDVLYAAEWFFTLLFTVEYLLRLWTAKRPLAYARSFYGVVDLLSVLPTWLSILFPPGRFLVVLRALRVLRVFRILKLAEYVEQGAVLSAALRASRYKITVFVSTVLILSVIVGSLMYLDVAPAGPLGKALAATLMIMGYGIIAVPTGIVTLELDRASRASAPRRECPGCGVDRHDADATFCKHCGTAL